MVELRIPHLCRKSELMYAILVVDSMKQGKNIVYITAFPCQ